MARSYRASPLPASDQSSTPVTLSPSTNTWSSCRSPCVNTGVNGRSAASATRRLRVTRSAGRTPLVMSHSHSPSSSDAYSSWLRTGPWRQRRVVQHPGGGTRRGPRRRRRGRRLAEAAECRPWQRGEREHGRLPPQDLRSRDRRHGHRLDLDVDACLISVDLQEHVADAQRRALVMGHDHLDFIHVGHHRGMTTDVATDLSRPSDYRQVFDLRGSWGGRWDLNPRHPGPQPGALPTELRPPWPPQRR